MKRSEMVNIIKIHLANQFSLDTQNEYYDLDYEARLFLTILESNGMLPPPRLEEQFNIKIEDKSFYCTWEPEDD
jgi:hypothetical protein